MLQVLRALAVLQVSVVRIPRVLAVMSRFFRGSSVLRIFPDVQYLGVRYWLWMIPVLESISGLCAAGTASIGSISPVGISTASARSTSSTKILSKRMPSMLGV